MKTNIKRHIALGVAISVISISAFSVYANEIPLPDISTITMNKGMIKSYRIGTQDFSGFVTSGIIDQATADKITAYMKEKQAASDTEREAWKAKTEEERQAGKGAFDFTAGLVTAGILTQEQADVIQADWKESIPVRSKISTGLGDFSALVTNGTIDQATADAIAAYWEQKKVDSDINPEVLQSMTEDELKAYREASKAYKDRSDIFTQMVTDGIVTETQAEAIKAELKTVTHKKFGFGGYGFSSYVESGLIDQATADKITAYFQELQQSKQAERASAKSLTEEERTAQLDRPERKDMFSHLVTEGIITQEQADAMKAAMPQKPETGGAFRPGSPAKSLIDPVV